MLMTHVYDITSYPVLFVVGSHLYESLMFDPRKS